MNKSSYLPAPARRLASRRFAPAHSLGAAFLFLAASASLGAQTLVDSFAGTTLDTAKWFYAESANSSSYSVGSDKLTLNMGTTASPHRALVLTQAGNFNPFENRVSISLGDLTLSGTPGTATANEFYAIIGHENDDTGTLTNANGVAYYNATGTAYGTGGALYLAVQKREAGYSLLIVDIGGGGKTTTTLAIDAFPTGIDWTIDGTGAESTWTVNLTGATFAGDLTSAGGTFSRFTEAALTSGADKISRVGVGVINSGTVSAATLATIGSVSITAIPEPSGAAALVGLSALGGAVLRRRSRR